MKIILLSFIVGFNLLANAQFGLRNSFNLTGTGRNISLLIEKDLNFKNRIGVGLRYNIGRIAHPDDQQNVFYKRLYPSSFIQHFGVEGLYQRMILRNWECIKPFISYDIQVSYSTTRNRMFLPYGEAFNGDILYKEFLEFFGPFLFVEQYVSLGFNAHLFGPLHIYQKTGGGIIFIRGRDEKLYGTYVNPNHWEFAGIISVGLVYSIK